MARRHTVFVANDTAGTRKDTAILLVGTAREFNISQQDIASTYSGFWITEELASLVYDETDGDEVEEQVVSGNPEPKDKAKAKATKKTSGNRAGTNKNSEGE